MTAKAVRMNVLWTLLVLVFLPASAFATIPAAYRLPMIPVAHPSFTPPSIDGRTEAFTVSLSDDLGSNLKGYGVSIISRTAFDERYAMDLQIGFAKADGNVGGVAPFAPIPYTFGPGGTLLGYCTTTVTGIATGDLLMGQASINVEYQPFRDRRGSVILFGGPNFTYQSMTVDIPYQYSFAPASFVSSATVDKQKSIATLAGLQIGALAAVNIWKTYQLSPFVMLSMASGTSSLSDSPAAAGVPGADATSSVSKSSATTFGLDINMGQFSIGMSWQQLKTTLDQVTSSLVDGTIIKTQVSRDDKIKLFRLGIMF